MKQAVGTTSIFKAVLAFTFIFSGFLAITIVYNKVFKMKNEILSILERYEGATTDTIGIINNYLENNGYTTKGNCADGEYGIGDLSSKKLEKVTGNKQYYYCLSDCTSNNCSVKTSGNKIYYSLRLFFKFNLPFVGDIFTFNINGQTKAIKYYTTKQKLS